MFQARAIIAIGMLCGSLPLLAQSAPSAAAPGASQSPDLQAIVQRVDQAARANRTHQRPYVLTREYRMYGEDVQKPSSEVVAEVNFVPPGTKDYKILESKGSSRGEGIVRHVLDDERKAAADREAAGAITSDHYDFEYLGEESLDKQDCFVLRIKPKHKDKTLIDGRAWIDKNTYLVRRVEGEMSKLPSWWLKSVHVVLTFANMDGMWMQDQTRAVAEVRIFGRHTFVSDTVKCRTGDTDAQRLGPKGHRGHGAAVLGAGIMHEQ